MKKKKVLKIIGLILFLIIIIAIIVVVGMYIGNKDYREYVDKNVFKKEITDANLDQIMLEDNSESYAYGRYVAVLNNNVLTIYNEKARKITSIDISVSTPKFASSGNYLLIADENDDNIYLINNYSLEWQKNIDGKVSELTVNSNGAVAVSLNETTYKSVIVMYDVTGKEIFKNYLSSSTVTELAISDDSAYLSYIEINTNNVYVDSAVKTISVEKAKKDPENAVIYTYSLDDKQTLLLNLKYKKDKLVLYADDGIYTLDKGNKEKTTEITANTQFATIDLDGYVCLINKASSDSSNNENTSAENSSAQGNDEQTENYEVNFVNVISGKKTVHLVDKTVKNMYSNGNVVAINEGSKVEFISTNGFLVKRFTPTQNFKNIIIGENIAIIAFKDKVEIVKI